MENIALLFSSNKHISAPALASLALSKEEASSVYFVNFFFSNRYCMNESVIIHASSNSRQNVTFKSSTDEPTNRLGMKSVVHLEVLIEIDRVCLDLKDHSENSTTTTTSSSNRLKKEKEKRKQRKKRRKMSFQFSEYNSRKTDQVEILYLLLKDPLREGMIL